MKLAKYIVKFYDPEIGLWYEGSPPMDYKTTETAAQWYARSFDVYIEFHSSK